MTLNDLIAANIARILALVAGYFLHTERAIRWAHPVGKFDCAGRWYPLGDENADDYTVNIRSPSRAYPLPYNKAARSLPHCLALADAVPEFVLSEARKTIGFKLYESGENTADIGRKAFNRAVAILKATDPAWLAVKAAKNAAKAEKAAAKDRTDAENLRLAAEQVATAKAAAEADRKMRKDGEEEVRALGEFNLLSDLAAYIDTQRGPPVYQQQTSTEHHLGAYSRIVSELLADIEDGEFARADFKAGCLSSTSGS